MATKHSKGTYLELSAASFPRYTDAVAVARQIHYQGFAAVCLEC